MAPLKRLWPFLLIAALAGALAMSILHPRCDCFTNADASSLKDDAEALDG